MKRLICWLWGHRWRELSVNFRKHCNLAHLHPMAGYRAVCKRCGAEWDDLWSPFFDDDVVTLEPDPLPTARARRAP